MMLGGFTGVRWHQPKLHALSYGRSLKTSSNIHCLFDPSNNGSYSMIPGLDNSYTIKLPSIQHLSKIAAATNTKIIKHKPSQPSHAPNFQVSIPVLVQCSLNDLCSLRLGNVMGTCERTNAHIHSRGSPPPWGKEFPTFCWIILRKGGNMRGGTAATECITWFVKTSLPFKPMLASWRPETCIA